MQTSGFRQGINVERAEHGSKRNFATIQNIAKIKDAVWEMSSEKVSMDNVGRNRSGNPIA